MKRLLSLLLLLPLLFSPPANAQFAAQATWGGTAAGTANAQTITIPNVSALADLVGVPLSFQAVAGNTGLTTLSVTGLAPTEVIKSAPDGLVSLNGGEIAPNGLVTVVYNGTWFLLQNSATSGAASGDIKITTTGTADAGYVLCAGQAISRTGTGLRLFAKIGTSYGPGDGSTTFNVPDLRGRMPAGLDNMGGAAANRITAAGGNFDGTVLGAAGGFQSKVVAQANLANFSLPATSTSTNTFSLSVSVPAQSSALGSASGQSPQSVFTPYSVTGSIFTATTTSVTSGGTSTPMATLSNTQIVAYEIKL